MHGPYDPHLPGNRYERAAPPVSPSGRACCDGLSLAICSLALSTDLLIRLDALVLHRSRGAAYRNWQGLIWLINHIAVQYLLARL